MVTKTSVYDMAVDSQEKYFLIVGQDKFIRSPVTHTYTCSVSHDVFPCLLDRMYGVSTGKKHTVIKIPTEDEGSIIKVTLDPSGLYVAASVTDKSVLIFDVYMGECIARISGHSGVF